MEYLKNFNIISIKNYIYEKFVSIDNLLKLGAPDSRQIWLPLNPLLKREKEKEGRASQLLAVFWSKVTRLIETSLARVSFWILNESMRTVSACCFFLSFFFFFLSFIFLSFFFFLLFPQSWEQLNTNTKAESYVILRIKRPTVDRNIFSLAFRKVWALKLLTDVTHTLPNIEPRNVQ